MSRGNRRAWLLAPLLLGLCDVAGAAPWEQIELQGPTTVRFKNGSVFQVNPSCSGGPEYDGLDLDPADRRFSFFLQRGAPHKLAVLFDGGGACWSAATCIGSALAGEPVYALKVDESPAQLAATGGLLDADNPQNPLADYTKVFIPYCTGDVHWGSRDMRYELPVAFGLKLKWTIHHRGADNLIAVLDWLKRVWPSTGMRIGNVRHLALVGVSAGAYGTINGFGYFAEAMPWARHYVIGDSGIGVLRGSFYRTAIYDQNNPGPGRWGMQKQLPGWVPGFSTLLEAAADTPNMLVPLALQSLAAFRPETRFAQLTSERDETQVAFYALMKSDVVPDDDDEREWTARMRDITRANASLPNYRFFVEAGDFHTFLASDSRTYTAGAAGVIPAEWLAAMLGGGGPWEHVDAP